MKNIVIIGSQWGDEGKGKITNLYSANADMVVRYQGGDNAGHTIKFNNQTYKLHLIPSGIFFPKCINILGNGVVINPKSLVNEINDLKEKGIPCDNLKISSRANIILDYHILLDQMKENKLKDNKIGTTKKGIGPAYTDKVSRDGIRFVDFVSDNFYDLLKNNIEEKNKILLASKEKELNFLEIYNSYEETRKILKPYLSETIYLINEYAKSDDKLVVFEGAQGAMLDVDFGTYPYVTSSNPTIGGSITGTGLNPFLLDESIGIVKAYTTRVGSGGFPSEIQGEIGNIIREKGHEYGTTTKRPRRIGWLDLVELKYSSLINGFTSYALMLLDVLSGLDKLKVCVGYKLDGKVIDYMPASVSDFNKIEPVYKEFPGFKEDIREVKNYDDLPINCKKYIEYIEEYTNVLVKIISVGPDFTETIRRN